MKNNETYKKEHLTEIYIRTNSTLICKVYVFLFWVFLFFVIHLKLESLEGDTDPLHLE